MGTRCLTFVYNDDDERVMCMYRQHDGYPSCHGSELATFMEKGKMTNGIPFGSKTHFFNGMEDFAAQLVCEMKTEDGGFYLFPTDTADAGQGFEYHVRYDHEANTFDIECSSYGTVHFKGALAEFKAWCARDDDEDLAP